MAYYPAHCDNECKGCEMNKCGWCCWKDRATPYYKTVAFKSENSSSDIYEPSSETAETTRYKNKL